ncbi:MAG: hypothetical protein DGJ47_000536 [Rickettsiaceae bacterium]
MESFVEIQFPTDISYGAKGGPVFSTDIITTISGHEQRNINWRSARARYDIASGIKTEQQAQQLIAFFRARHGKAVGFRYKDWSDYKAELQLIGTGDGSNRKFQLQKNYSSGGKYYQRSITKAVENSLTIYVNRMPVRAKVNFTNGNIELVSAPANKAQVRASFEFDVPVRFDTDHLDMQIDNFNLSSWHNIPLVEVRI